MRAILLMAAAASLCAQPVVHVQSPSSLSLENKDGGQILEITNSNFEVTGDVIGLPNNERLVLRTITHSKQFVGDEGEEALTTVEAWPFGSNLQQKPLYSVTASGEDRRTINDEVFQILRGLEEVEWWSVYRLATGEHLFDTYVPLVSFSISRDTVTNRYVGLEVPEDNAADKRLREPHVVSVLTYASAERVLHEALITSDDPKQAVLLRSLADSSRSVTYSAHTVRIAITEDYPSPPNTATITIPIVHDNLDLAHVQAPPHVHVASWQRVIK